jgi:hypothetical protein
VVQQVGEKVSLVHVVAPERRRRRRLRVGGRGRLVQRRGAVLPIPRVDVQDPVPVLAVAVRLDQVLHDVQVSVAAGVVQGGHASQKSVVHHVLDLACRLGSIADGADQVEVAA